VKRDLSFDVLKKYFHVNIMKVYVTYWMFHVDMKHFSCKHANILTGYASISTFRVDICCICFIKNISLRSVNVMSVIIHSL